MTTSDAQRAIEAVWRIEAPKLIAGLARRGRVDKARAEFERAAAPTRHARERGLLLDQVAACARGVAH